MLPFVQLKVGEIPVLPFVFSDRDFYWFTTMDMEGICKNVEIEQVTLPQLNSSVNFSKTMYFSYVYWNKPGTSTIRFLIFQQRSK